MQELKNKGAPMHSLLFTKISVIPAGFEPTTKQITNYIIFKRLTCACVKY